MKYKIIIEEVYEIDEADYPKIETVYAQLVSNLDVQDLVQYVNRKKVHGISTEEAT